MPPHFHGGGGGGHHHAHRQQVERAASPAATLARLFRLLKGRRRAVAVLLVPLLLSSLAGIVWPRVLGLAMDEMKLGEVSDASVDMRRFTVILAVGTIAVLIGQATRLWLSFGTVALSNKTVRDMRMKLFGHIQSLPIARFDSMTHGEFMSRLTNDIDMVANTLGPGILEFAGAVFALVGTLGYMLWLSPALTAVSCVTLPLTFLMGRGIARVSRRLFRARQKTLGEMNGLVEEMIGGQSAVRAFCREEAVGEDFRRVSSELRRLSLKAETLGSFMWPSMNMINNLSFLLVASFGGWLAVRSDGAVTVGMVIAFMMYARQFGWPVNHLANQFNQIQSAIAGAERVFAVFDMQAEADDGTLEARRAEIKGAIEFDAVTFGYDPARPVLKDFTLRVAPGAKIALVGETGSGKTTVINLLSRFYEPDAGRILVDGIDIRRHTKTSLRACMAVVLQDTRLFSGTIAENIAFGRPDATRDEIAAAARLANADHFIDRFPDAYDTRISQSETQLSQGQRQLIAIARAALSDPAILILDEATSNVDTRTELHIQQAMQRLMRDRTSLIIAHRVSTIRDADRILVMRDGCIAESGSHAELMSLGGIYAGYNKG